MKLKNKKTGEIVDAIADEVVVTTDDNIYSYEKLAELCEDWEDAPEEWWFIDNDGLVNRVTSYDRRIQMHRDCKEFGNYFSTKEEAELAVRKLKAWKRLKDNGFRFQGIEFQEDYVVIKTNFHRPLMGEELDLSADSANEDLLNILFGSE